MKVIVLSSGSKGNTTYIECGNTKILIDMGNSCKYVVNKLEGIGINAGDIDAIFITHTHSDHIKGLKVFLKKYNTKVYFTEKMKEDPFKLYDILVSTGIFTVIVDVIREKDWVEIQENVWSTIKNIYDYKNSVMGILESVKEDYNAVNLDMEDLKDKMANPEDLALLKDILAKLG